MSSPTLIVGAGLAGLTCARFIEGPYRLIERSDRVGGAAVSTRRGEFVFDVTGHWLHLRDDGIRALVSELLGEVLTVERRASVWSGGIETPYPFQTNTFGRPAEVIADCVVGFFEAREREAAGSHGEPRSFEEFIRQRMGNGIAEHFMIPYNTKLWTIPPSEMDFSWCERFVPLPEPRGVILGAITAEGEGRPVGYNATFSYPTAGGIGELPVALARSLAAGPELGRRHDHVDWRGQVATVDGERVPYRRLVSTLPLPGLVDRLKDPPAEVREARDKLRATDVTYWDLGFAAPHPAAAPHWTYYPDPDIPFYRVGSPSAAVPYLAPPGHRSYYVETAHPAGTPAPVNDETMLAGLRRVGLIGDGEQPVVMERITLPGAYVIMDHAYGGARRVVLDWLRQQSIFSIGRYGAWTYDSMEGAMIQGRELAHELRSEN